MSNVVFFLSRRLSLLSFTKRNISQRLSALIIALSLFSLITVTSVINGFQLSFINALLAVGSYHIQVTSGGEPVDAVKDEISSVTPFYDSQCLLNSGSFSSAAILRALPFDVCLRDDSFFKECVIVSGAFDLSRDNFIVIGSSLCAALNAAVGDTISAFALSSGSAKNILDDNKTFIVMGIFDTAYYALNEGYAFIKLGDEVPTPLRYGLKLRDKNKAQRVSQILSKNGFSNKTYVDMNRSYFGALATEKAILSAVMLLIVAVIAGNIYATTRRTIIEKARDIAILISFGATKSQVQLIFILRAFITSIVAVVAALVLGLLAVRNMGLIFLALGRATYFFQYIAAYLFDRASLPYVTENQMFFVYSSIKAVIGAREVALFSFFCTFAPVAFTTLSSSAVLKTNVVEALSNE